MKRAARLIAALQIFREWRTPLTASGLGDRLGVSRRTAYRDIEALVALGAPLEGAAGVGFVLRGGYFLPPLSLTAAEADAIMLGLRFVERRADAGLGAAAWSAKSKVEAILKEDLRHASDVNGLLVGVGLREPDTRLQRLREALERESKVAFGYRNARGIRTTRIVWPVAIGFFDDCEMLAGWCERREDFRNFRLDRMHDLRVLGTPLPLRRAVLLGRWRAQGHDRDA